MLSCPLSLLSIYARHRAPAGLGTVAELRAAQILTRPSTGRVSSGFQGLIDSPHPAGHFPGTVDVMRLHVLCESVLNGGGEGGGGRGEGGSGGGGGEGMRGSKMGRR